MKRAARKYVKVAVNWIHLMPAKMADCLVGKMALMRASLAGGQMAVRGAAQWVSLMTV